eukprot:COSAG05_NODE_3144_length_2288_cov_2.298310_1_plen_113_part_10
MRPSLHPPLSPLLSALLLLSEGKVPLTAVYGECLLFLTVADHPYWHRISSALCFSIIAYCCRRHRRRRAGVVRCAVTLYDPEDPTVPLIGRILGRRPGGKVRVAYIGWSRAAD